LTTPVIIDFILAGILAGFTLLGARRGLLRTLAGLVIVIAALVGAAMIASALTPLLSSLAAPAIEEKITEEVDGALGPEPESAELPEILELLGWDEASQEALASDVRETVRDTGVSVLAAVAQSLAKSVIYGVLYIVSFLALLVLLHVLAKAMDLLAKLPGLHALNALGGAALGLAEGAVLLALAVYAARCLGFPLGTAPWSEAALFTRFVSFVPV